MNRLLTWIICCILLLFQGCRSKVDRGLGGHAAQNYAIVKIYYATDRKRTSISDPGVGYSGERGEIQYGNAKVSIPRNHKMGNLEGPSVWKFQFRADPEKHVVLLDVKPMETDSYFRDVAARVKKSSGRNAFVFVHGFNVTFNEAARRTAQISYDLGFDGAPVFYSWPSQGELAKYMFDENNAAWSAANLERFLADFSQKSTADRIYLIAHSMGSRVLTQAYVSLLRNKPNLREKFAEVILAAPDLDAEVFRRDLVPAMVGSGCKITLYASSEDIPLKAARELHGGYARAGESGLGLVLADGVETIDATDMRADFMNHSYFAQNRSIISDIFQIVRNGLRADRRFGLETVTHPNSGRVYWRFKQ